MILHAILPLVTTVANLVGIKKGKETEVKSVSSLSEKEMKRMLKDIKKKKASK